MRQEIVMPAPAKINWGLAITGRRADGYHLLRSLMHSVSLSDTLTLRANSVDICICDPPLPDSEANIALAAWHLLKHKFELPGGLFIEISKRIPVGGGLAGGSSNAAAVMRGVNLMFDLGLSTGELAALALKLGADIPFCLHGGLCRVEGIGEKILPLSVPFTYHLTLVNPGFPVSTAAVYKQFAWQGQSAMPDIDALERALLRGDKQSIAGHAANMLEAPAFALYPELAQLKRYCRGLGLTAVMSGSGGSMWLLADSPQMAADMAADLRRHYSFATAVSSLAQIVD